MSYYSLNFLRISPQRYTYATYVAAHMRVLVTRALFIRSALLLWSAKTPLHSDQFAHGSLDQSLDGSFQFFLDGQSLHLAGVKDGFYALISTVNPEAVLLEADYDNDAALVYLELRGDRLEVISKRELLDLRCAEAGWC